MADHSPVPGGTNARLVGQSGSRSRLSTPALVLELDMFERNLKTMADFLAVSGCDLRPHAKAHKSARVAAEQIAAGAIGICCATLQEAEAMAAGGIDGLLVTSPVVAEPMIARLVALNATVPDLVAVVDHPDSAAALAAAAEAAGQTLSIMVECDIGQKRTGTVGTEAAVTLARRVAETEALRYRGIQAYYGHLQHVAVYEERAAATAGPRRAVRDIVEALGAAGLEPEIVTGGGTGTHHIDAEDGVFTEVQAGSYAFMDSQYDAVALWPDTPRPFGDALFVQGTVVSANQPDYLVVDCGWKAFATEGETPIPAEGAREYRFMGDEHGAVVPDDPAGTGLGSTIAFKAPHCDPTINLFSALHCVRDDVLVDIWPIEARGY